MGVAADAKRPKTIILFSDGTGNSSAKQFKTNVWRMYESVDLGPTADRDLRLQIAHYDNGVGTSNFRPLAWLGGIFGFGLRDGVLRLYCYLCRNYNEGDSIYAFGFSRGAFTIRLLVALIATQGVLRCNSESELTVQARGAYRELCRELLPNRRFMRPVTYAVRWLRDRVVDFMRRIRKVRPYGEVARTYPFVDFVGVWDTVAAYGGPIVEMTRGIDDWIWPLTMPNYALSVKVRRASHALALDDAREAFHPLLWDEHREDGLVTLGKETPVAWNEAAGAPEYALVKPAAGRLNQVWFSGMHADVGGGYPDESLSYVSLLWMMDEARKGVPEDEQLRFLKRYVGRAQDFANPYGPVHNSRSGLGSYYRYQPRRLAAYLKEDFDDHLAHRDPQARLGDDGRIERRELLREIRLHESVIARIASGTDNYAPVSIPARFEVAPAAPRGSLSATLLTAADRRVFADPDARARRAAELNSVWDKVWWRRLAYYCTMLASLILLAFPWLPVLGINPKLPLVLRNVASSDWIAGPIQWIRWLTPDVADRWLFAFALHPFWFVVFAVLLLLTIWFGQRLDQKVADRSRTAWRGIQNGVGDAPPRSILSRIRLSFPYQRSLYHLRWFVLPTLFAILVVAAVVTAPTTLVLLRTSISTAAQELTDADPSKPRPAPVQAPTAPKPELAAVARPAPGGN
jgi:uncharacterized protein (DUF2235 family)